MSGNQERYFFCCFGLISGLFWSSAFSFCASEEFVSVFSWGEGPLVYLIFWLTSVSGFFFLTFCGLKRD